MPVPTLAQYTGLRARRSRFVFHGGSGSTPHEIAEAVSHEFVNYAAVVRADCGIGDKRAYDPRTWSRSAEHAMAARVVDACHQLGSAGRSLTAR